MKGSIFFTEVALAVTVLSCLAIFGSATGALAQAPPIFFEDFVAKRMTGKEAEWNLEKFCPVSTKPVAARVLETYGAMYVATESITLPKVCVYDGEASFLEYRKDIKTSRMLLADVDLEFQESAAAALRLANTEIQQRGLRITPLDGAIAGPRTYGDTLQLWNSRFFPALDFWIKRGRLSEADRLYVGGLDLEKKVEKVLEWESQGIFFSTDRTRSIMTSTAPPGSSQHLALMALDVVEYWNSDVRSALNRNGWFQTVVGDPPHFTYLGVPETELPSRGLRAVSKGGFQFWVPNLKPKADTPN